MELTFDKKSSLIFQNAILRLFLRATGFAPSFVATKLREERRGEGESERQRPKTREERRRVSDKDRKRNQCVCVVKLLFVKTRHD
jgi:hypothetical protein